MLEHLSIKNYALIQELSLDFQSGFNVLTGETGAGKSIIIGAFRLLLGERADTDSFRDPKLPILLEASFNADVLPRVQKIFEEETSQPFEKGESLIFRREISPEGKNKCFINNRLVNLSALKNLGIYLVDFHGQYDHQLLLDSSRHMGFIDDFGKIKPLLESYRKIYAVYAEKKARMRELQKLEETKLRELDLLNYQINELEKAELEEGMETALVEEKLLLANAEKIHELVAQTGELLYDGSQSASDRLSAGLETLQDLAQYDSKFNKISKEIEKAYVICDEAARELQKYQQKISFDPERLDFIQEKLVLVDKLKRKYGNTTKEMLSFLESATARRDALQDNEANMKEIVSSLKRDEKELTAVAEKIHEKRLQTAEKIQRSVEAELKDLGMADAVISAVFEKGEFTANGFDSVSFYISANKGETEKPLSKIASGGEAARIMLAFKKILSAVDQVGTLIFDEIDSNIGGRLGKVVGEKIQSIAKNRQVLLITHLPQIASFADIHFKVVKVSEKHRVTTRCDVLNKKERVEELAQMMSGQEVTKISKKHAEEMMESV